MLIGFCRLLFVYTPILFYVLALLRHTTDTEAQSRPDLLPDRWGGSPAKGPRASPAPPRLRRSPPASTAMVWSPSSQVPSWKTRFYASRLSFQQVIQREWRPLWAWLEYKWRPPNPSGQPCPGLASRSDSEIALAAKELPMLSGGYLRRCVERHRAGDGACSGVARRARRHGRPQRLRRARGQGGHRGQDPRRKDWRPGAGPQLHSFRKEIRLPFRLSELAPQHSHVSTNKSFYFMTVLSQAVKSMPEIIVVY